MYLANEPAGVPYPSPLDHQTLAEDVRHGPEVWARRPTVFFRPGDRSLPERAGYWAVDAQGISYIRFITQYGNHEQGRRPVFAEEAQPVRVRSRVVKALQEVTPQECAHAYAELTEPQAVLAWLQQKYPALQLDLGSIVTVYTVAYD